MSLQDQTRYAPLEVEQRTFERWRAEPGLFSPAVPSGDEEVETFTIAVPPPNVTGALHMGHALNGSIQDALIRFNRMRGKRTRWILGTDHAGIAVQTKVEQLLASEGTSRHEVGRDEFLRRVWEWRHEYGGTIIGQFQRLGLGLDYERERFTYDDAYVEAVLETFVRLHDKGLIYRDNRLVNWDPGSQSAISDLEVVEQQVTDTLYSIDYPLASGSGSITVATVRPETMLADAAIAVHPGDPRYTRLVGERAILPLVGRSLPIIADEYVKTEFGTGALKITPGHDPNDFELGRKHGLEELTVIGEDGRMTEAAGQFAGMRVLEAREAVVAALRAEGRISGQVAYDHAVPHSDRSGERIEPLISLQWFMKMDELAKPAIAAAQDGRLQFKPARYARQYTAWLEQIRPWCVSRQLWWGHRLPVWYRGEETWVGLGEPEGEGWEQDPDVLDTWFSSGLWPFATLGWPLETDDLRAFYPTDVLSTARDIIFLWVARMVMLGMELTGEVPFHTVNIHPTVQAPDGRRMSKSLGTGLDPLELIDAHGADATRFGLLAMSSTQDVRFNEGKIEQGGKLANKLFNASRLILLGTEGAVPDASAASEPEDRWILSRLERAKAAFAADLEAMDFAKAALGLYDFVFGELCDWYLELAKPRLAEAGPVARHVLRETLALAHPIIPFVTEELWGHCGADGLLAAAPFPEPHPERIDEAAEAQVGRAIAAVQALRSWRQAMGAKPGPTLPARLQATGFEGVEDLVARLGRVEWTPPNGTQPAATVAVEGGVVELLPTEHVDFAAADQRREKERARLGKEVERLEKKLGNEKFVANAPADVVQKERDKLAGLQAELDAL